MVDIIDSFLLGTFGHIKSSNHYQSKNKAVTFLTMIQYTRKYKKDFVFCLNEKVSFLTFE